MRNLKKILALVLALMMVLSMMVTASALDFADADEIEKTEAVSVMTGLEVLAGKATADGEFNFDPKGLLKRQEAAKILAYVMTGDYDYITEVAAHLTHPFTDVAKGDWAEAYIAYCYDAGILSGMNATTFGYNSYLTGYQLGKLLLCAAGIGEKADYEGDGYEVKVFKALKLNGLLTNVTIGHSYITREDACQLVWNVMNWSPDGETVEYVVTAGETEIYRGTDALTATLIAEVKDGAELDTEITSVGSLADTVFNLVCNESTDAYGRVTKVYTSNIENMSVALANDTTPVIFVAAAAVSADAAGINTLLGTELTDGTVSVKLNGAAYEGGINIGDTVEVYATNGVISKIIIVRETLETATVAAEPEAEGTYAGLYKWTFGSAFTYGAADAYTKNASYLVIAKGTQVLNVSVPTVVTGKIAKADDVDLTAASYVYVDGAKLVKATDCNDSIEGLNFGVAYDYVMNSTGYLVAIVAHNSVVTEEELETGYAWLLDAEKQVTTNSVGTTLIGGTGSYAWDVVAVAKLALADGTVAVVDLTTEVTWTSGAVTGLKINGQNATNCELTNDAAPVKLMAEGNLFNGYNWVKYEIQKDGTYTLEAVTGLTTAYLNKSTGSVNLGSGNYKFATSTTEWNSYVFDEATQTVSVTNNVGIASFDSAQHSFLYTINAQVNANVITKIDSFAIDEVEEETDSVKYAYYIGVGDYVGSVGSYTHNFYIGGAVVENFIGELAEGSVAEAALSNDVYTLTYDADGLITNIALSEGTTVKNVVVDFVDDTFMAYEGNTYAYYFYNTEIYNISTGHTGEADEISEGDTITFVWNTYGSSSKRYVYAIYIIAEAE